MDLTAVDGIKLRASYFGSGRPGPGIVLLHQCNRQRKVWDGLAAQLVDRGFHVLTLDYRGYGESEGPRFLDLPSPEQNRTQAEKWPGDVDLAYRYLLAQPGVSQDVVGAGGASCGVNQSIQLARRHPEVRSLVLLSGQTDRSGREYLRNAPGTPVFVSAADDDGGVALIMEWLRAASASRQSRFMHFGVAGHGTDMFAVQKRLPGLIVQWFGATLRHDNTLGNDWPPRDSSAAPELKAEALATLDLLDTPQGTGRLIERLKEARKKDPAVALVPEAVVNLAGYERLQAGEVKQAIEIFIFNTVAYPESANACDSLADGYAAAGDGEAAHRYAKRALELLASDTTSPAARREAIRKSAEQKLKPPESTNKPPKGR